MYRNILVPLDGSPFAEQAIPIAVEIARRSGGHVTLARVHVSLAPAFAHGMPPFDYEVERGTQGQVRAYLEPVAKRYQETGIDVEPLMLDGGVVEALCNCVNERNIDLVVASTHGRGPVARFWLGSIADELVRKLSVPVLAVRPDDAPEPAPRALRHILVPLDGSKLAESILEPMMKLGDPADLQFTLLRVLPPPTAPVGPVEFGATFVDPDLVLRLQELEANERCHAEKYMAAVAARLREHCRNVETCLVTAEPAAMTILDEARARKADAIAIASHGRGGMARLLLGSVADKVLRGATMPVLLCHPVGQAAHRHADEHAVTVS